MVLNCCFDPVDQTIDNELLQDLRYSRKAIASHAANSQNQSIVLQPYVEGRNDEGDDDDNDDNISSNTPRPTSNMVKITVPPHCFEGQKLLVLSADGKEKTPVPVPPNCPPGDTFTVDLKTYKQHKPESIVEALDDFLFPMPEVFATPVYEAIANNSPSKAFSPPNSSAQSRSKSVPAPRKTNSPKPEHSKAESRKSPSKSSGSSKRRSSSSTARHGTRSSTPPTPKSESPSMTKKEESQRSPSKSATSRQLVPIHTNNGRHTAENINNKNKNNNIDYGNNSNIDYDKNDGYDNNDGYDRYNSSPAPSPRTQHVQGELVTAEVTRVEPRVPSPRTQLTSSPPEKKQGPSSPKKAPPAIDTRQDPEITHIETSPSLIDAIDSFLTPKPDSPVPKSQPSTPKAPVQAFPQQKVLLVNVPPGMPAGTIMQVEIPGENRTLSAQVPPNVSSFHLAYSPLVRDIKSPSGKSSTPKNATTDDKKMTPKELSHLSPRHADTQMHKSSKLDESKSKPKHQQNEPPATVPSRRAPASQKLLLVRVPPGTGPGTTLHVSVPDEPGRILAAEVPPGNVKEFHVAYEPRNGKQQQPPSSTPKRGMLPPASAYYQPPHPPTDGAYNANQFQHFQQPFASSPYNRSIPNDFSGHYSSYSQPSHYNAPPPSYPTYDHMYSAYGNRFGNPNTAYNGAPGYNGHVASPPAGGMVNYGMPPTGNGAMPGYSPYEHFHNRQNEMQDGNESYANESYDNGAMNDPNNMTDMDDVGGYDF